MKHTSMPSTPILLGAFAISVVIGACSKNTLGNETGPNIPPVSVVHSTDTTIFGTWYWIRSGGGISGGTITPSSVGHTRKLILRSDSSYASYCHDTLVCAATFTTHRELIPRSNEYVTLILFAGAPMPTIWQSIALEGSDTLHINDYNIADGYSNTYVRIGLAE